MKLSMNRLSSSMLKVSSAVLALQILALVWRSQSSTLLPSNPQTLLNDDASAYEPLSPPPRPEPYYDTAAAVPNLAGFPMHVWQKTSFKGLSSEIGADLGSWRTKNPFFTFTLLDDARADDFVRQHYSDYPDIYELYFALRVPILKADLLRYLILYAEGGIWADLDTECVVPVEEWVPVEMFEAANVLVGIEYTDPFRGPDGAMIGSQFASWTIMAKARSAHMLQVIEDIVQEMRDIARVNGVGYEGIELGMISDVVDVTGPYKMTLGIVRSLRKRAGGGILDDRDLMRLREPKVFADLLVLPGASFAAMMNDYPTDQGEVMVTHHYAGSWKEEADAARLAWEGREIKREEEVEPEEGAEREIERGVEVETEAEAVEAPLFGRRRR